jgi:hypothetical protein
MTHITGRYLQFQNKIEICKIKLLILSQDWMDSMLTSASHSPQYTTQSELSRIIVEEYQKDINMKSLSYSIDDQIKAY